MMKPVIDFFNYLQQIGLISHTVKKPKKTDLQAICEISYLPPELISFYEQQFKQAHHCQPTNLPEDIRRLLPGSICKRYTCTPYAKHQGQVYVCCRNPFDEDMRATLEKEINQPIAYHLANSQHIERLLNLYYHAYQTEEAETAHTDTVNTAAIDETIDQILLQAYARDASDIHIQADKDSFYYKMRRFSQFQPNIYLPHKIAQIFKNRLLVRANVPFNQLNQAQDCSITTQHKPVFTVRISFIPVLDGFSLVLRIIRPLQNISLDELLSQSHKSLLKQQLQRCHDTIIIYGPTSTGKSTLYYHLIKQLIAFKKKVVTMEDPIESPVTHAFQIDMGHSESTYDEHIKQALRQDPEAIAFSEIRTDSAVNALAQAKMSGCLTLLTIHANNPTECLIKLLKMGYPPHELFNQHITFLATRLIPEICPVCESTMTLSEENLDYLHQHVPGYTNQELKESMGCLSCYFTGIDHINSYLHLSSIDRSSLQKWLDEEQWLSKAEKSLTKEFYDEMNEKLSTWLLSGKIDLTTFMRMKMC